MGSRPPVEPRVESDLDWPQRRRFEVKQVQGEVMIRYETLFMWAEFSMALHLSGEYVIGK